MALNRIFKFGERERNCREPEAGFSLKLLFFFTLASFLVCFISAPVYAIPDIVPVNLYEARVNVKELILNNVCKVVSPHSQVVGSPHVKTVFEASGSKVALYSVSGGKKNLVLKSRLIRLEELNDRGVALTVIGRPTLVYKGSITITSKNGELSVINEVPVREFVYSIVASELPLHFHREAKKALAVMTLTRLEFLPDARAIGDSTKSELYTGCASVRDVDRDTVNSVWRKRLYYKGTLALPYYHSTCAGRTSSGKEFFVGSGEDLTYLSSVECTHCKNSPFYKFRVRRVPEGDVTKLFSGALPFVLKRDRAERPLEVSYGKNIAPITGYKAWIKLGRGIGWGRVPGTRFYLKSVTSDKIKFVELSSSGAGHGVGLCQWGAHQLAKAGKKYDFIVKYYYPLCEVK